MNLTLKVEGMSCQHCVNAIKKQLEKSGLKNFNVKIGLVEINLSDTNFQLSDIKNMIEEAGYKVINE
jgi:copper chaperone